MVKQRKITSPLWIIEADNLQVRNINVLHANNSARRSSSTQFKSICYLGIAKCHDEPVVDQSRPRYGVFPPEWLANST